MVPLRYLRARYFTIMALMLAGCTTAIQPSATNTPQPTSTNTPVPPTDTLTPSATATDTATQVPPTLTPTDTATDTPVPPTATLAYTPLPRPTNTSAPVTPVVQPTIAPPPATAPASAANGSMIVAINVVSNSSRTMVVEVTLAGLFPGLGYNLVSYADTVENCPVHCRQFGKAQSGVTYIFRPDADTSVRRLNVEIDNLLCQGASPFTTDRLTVDLRLVTFGYPLLDKATFPATNTWCT